MLHWRETQLSLTTTTVVLIVSSLVAATTAFAVWTSTIYNNETTTNNNNIQKKDTDDDTIIRNNTRGDELEFWKTQRQEERAGRIRAEIKLRQTMKELKQLQMDALVLQQQHINGIKAKNYTSDSNTECTNSYYGIEHQKIQEDCNSNNVENGNHPRTTNNHRTMLLLESIGHVVSPFTKRMGTPRQPQLVPDSRGYIQMTCPRECLDGITEYSHLWILFEFHANTNVLDTASNGTSGSSKQKNQSTTSSKKVQNQNQQQRTKIRPPRSPNKVGQLATRTPHRINPIGLSLVSISTWDPNKRQLHITGLDLVNGTPVYDIKPCVPWDIPGYYKNNHKSYLQSVELLQQSPTNDSNQCILPMPQQTTRSSSLATTLPLSLFGLTVPDWVIQEDEISNVTFTTNALQQLHDCLINQQLLAPFYTNDDDGYATCIRAIQQILAQDPRSSHKGLKTNARGTISIPQPGRTTTTTTQPQSSFCSNLSSVNDYTTSTSIATLNRIAVDSTTIEHNINNEINTNNHKNNNALDDLHMDNNDVENYCYNIIFVQIRVSFIVLDDGIIQVKKIEPIQFDSTSYVDGVPLILPLVQEHQQEENESRH